MTINEEVAEYWAESGLGSRKSDHLSCKGPSLYSYNVEIARIVDNVAYFQHRGYSMATSKHGNMAMRAVKRRGWITCEGRWPT